MNHQEEKRKIIVPLQKTPKFSQEEIDEMVVEIIADAIRAMKQKKPRKN